MNYILSILIPTKNRKNYLVNCIDEVLASCTNNVQVIVQDNSDVPWSKLELEKYSKYSNFEYYHEYGAVSFVDNFSKALEKAKGNYVCFIGDDDGVMPEIEIVVDWMNKNNIDALSQNISATFFWPNNQKVIKKSENGLLRLYYANNTVSVKKVEGELKKLFGTGGLYYLRRGLVKPYHGIVKRKYFEKIKSKTGVYINGLSPDIYASVALSTLIKNNYIINYPITISGISPKSGSAASVNGTHTGELKEAPHFNGHSDYKWDSLVPEIYSVETIWADSALHAARDLDISYVNEKFCYSYLLHTCKQRYPQFSEKYSEFEMMHPYKYFRFVLEYIKFDVFENAKRILKRITRKKQDYIELSKVENIQEAQLKVKEYLADNEISIENTLEGLDKLKKDIA